MKKHWNSAELKQRAKLSQWGLLIAVAVGFYGLFNKETVALVVALGVAILSQVYFEVLRKKDRMITPRQ